eukprot:GHVT01018081.1.p1 GENE.GHVT01018081.1~~GHVT01018081.1.p1  ORF type:complete len:586 (-),score=72.67 GHVT01018081.1:40-1797(-)
MCFIRSASSGSFAIGVGFGGLGRRFSSIAPGILGVTAQPHSRRLLHDRAEQCKARKKATRLGGVVGPSWLQPCLKERLELGGGEGNKLSRLMSGPSAVVGDDSTILRRERVLAALAQLSARVARQGPAKRLNSVSAGGDVSFAVRDSASWKSIRKDSAPLYALSSPRKEAEEDVAETAEFIAAEIQSLDRHLSSGDIGVAIQCLLFIHNHGRKQCNAAESSGGKCKARQTEDPQTTAVSSKPAQELFKNCRVFKSSVPSLATGEAHHTNAPLPAVVERTIEGHSSFVGPPTAEAAVHDHHSHDAPIKVWTKHLSALPVEPSVTCAAHFNFDSRNRITADLGAPQDAKSRFMSSFPQSEFPLDSFGLAVPQVGLGRKVQLASPGGVFQDDRMLAALLVRRFCARGQAFAPYSTALVLLAVGKLQLLSQLEAPHDANSSAEWLSRHVPYACLERLCASLCQRCAHLADPEMLTTAAHSLVALHLLYQQRLTQFEGSNALRPHNLPPTHAAKWKQPALPAGPSFNGPNAVDHIWAAAYQLTTCTEMPMGSTDAKSKPCPQNCAGMLWSAKQLRGLSNLRLTFTRSSFI